MTDLAARQDALALINIARGLEHGPTVPPDHLATFATIITDHLRAVTVHQLVGSLAGFAAGAVARLAVAEGITADEVMVDLGKRNS